MDREFYSNIIRLWRIEGSQLMSNRLETCVRQKIGSCRGCTETKQGIDLVRWRGFSVAEAESRLQQTVCPEGEHPDIVELFNYDAFYAFGQPREENLEGLQDIGRPSSNPLSGKKISKSRTGTWFQKMKK